MNQKLYSGTEKCVIELEKFNCTIYCEHEAGDFREECERISKHYYKDFYDSVTEHPDCFSIARLSAHTSEHPKQEWVVYPPSLSNTERVVDFCTWLGISIVIGLSGDNSGHLTDAVNTASLICKKLLEHKANDQE